MKDNGLKKVFQSFRTGKDRHIAKLRRRWQRLSYRQQRVIILYLLGLFAAIDLAYIVGGFCGTDKFPIEVRHLQGWRFLGRTVSNHSKTMYPMTQSDKKEEVKEKETLKAEPVSQKEKKLSGKTAGKLKFYGVVAFLSLLCAGFIWFLFKPDAADTVEGIAGINTTIPDAIAPETMADKQKAYELEEMKKRRQEKVRTLQDMAGDLTPDTPDGLKPEEDTPKADAIRESREKQRQISRQITAFYQEPKESPRVDELERQVKELNEKLERERKGQDPLELMEKSYEMAARYFPGQTGGQVKNIQPADGTGSSSGNPAAIVAGRTTENVVSSLASPPLPDSIPRNYGFATAVGGGQLAGANTIRACVAEDQTVTTGA